MNAICEKAREDFFFNDTFHQKISIPYYMFYKHQYSSNTEKQIAKNIDKFSRTTSRLTQKE